MALPSGEEDSVALDADLIKVLAADSRRDILRLLGERRMTLTEISHRLGLGKATVLEHLKRLVEADLVRRHEDERLWVYYELTRKGGRFVNPGRTRFYLLLAGSALALALGVALAAAMMGGDAPPAQHSGSSGPEGYVALESAQAGAEGTFSVRARVLSPGATSGSDLQAYLVTEDAARTLDSSSTPVQGVPLLPLVTLGTGSADDAGGAAGPSDAPAAPTGEEVPATAPTPRTTSDGTRAEAQLLTLNVGARVALPPGAYYLAVVGPTGRPALSDSPALVVPSVEVQLSPPIAWRGIDEGVRADVTQLDEPAPAGVLALTPTGAAEPSLWLLVVNGSATIDAAQLDALEAGRYALAFHPADESVPVQLADPLDVRDPRLALSPALVAAGTNVTATLSVVGPAEGAPVSVRLDGLPLANATTGAGTPLRLSGLDAGNHTLQVGRVANLTLRAEPRVVVDLASEGNASTLRTLDGRPMPDVRVFVDGARAATTDANGSFTLAALDEGVHVLSVGAAPGATTARAFNASAGGLAFVSPSLDVRVEPGPPAAPGELSFRVAISGASGAEVPAMVEVFVDDAPADAFSVDVPPSGAARIDLVYSGFAAGDRAVRAVATPFLTLVAPEENLPAPTGGAATSDGFTRDDAPRDVRYGYEKPGATGALSVRVAPETVAFETLPGSRVIPRTPTGDAAVGEPAAVPAPSAALALALVALAAWASRRRWPPRA